MDVEYESLPVILDPIEAMKPGAPLIHERMGEYTHAPDFHPVAGTNIANKFTLIHGDVEKGFDQADEAIERSSGSRTSVTRTWRRQNATAQYNRDGTVEICPPVSPHSWSGRSYRKPSRFHRTKSL